jgi:hypothetical protein
MYSGKSWSIIYLSVEKWMKCKIILLNKQERSKLKCAENWFNLCKTLFTVKPNSAYWIGYPTQALLQGLVVALRGFICKTLPKECDDNSMLKLWIDCPVVWCLYMISLFQHNCLVVLNWRATTRCFESIIIAFLFDFLQLTVIGNVNPHSISAWNILTVVCKEYWCWHPKVYSSINLHLQVWQPMNCVGILLMCALLQKFFAITSQITIIIVL